MCIYKDIPSIIDELKKEYYAETQCSMKEMKIGENSLVIFRDRSLDSELGNLLESFDLVIFEGDKKVEEHTNMSRDEARIIHDNFVEKYSENK